MVLLDTSVWVDHFRHANEQVSTLLRNNEALSHPMVIGELSCGVMRSRQALLMSLQRISRCTVANDSEVFHLIESEKLWGKGIGWIDVHLLASTRLSGATLWTLDRRLQKAATRLGLAA